jgi:hypothetical protein
MHETHPLFAACRLPFGSVLADAPKPDPTPSILVVDAAGRRKIQRRNRLSCGRLQVGLASIGRMPLQTQFWVAVGTLIAERPRTEPYGLPAILDLDRNRPDQIRRGAVKSTPDAATLILTTLTGAIGCRRIPSLLTASPWRKTQSAGRRSEPGQRDRPW